MVLVAVLGDGHALDQFHDEEGPSGGCGAPIEDLSNVGMIHDGQGLPLRLKPGHDLARIHTGLQHFQGHFAANGLSLLGHENDAEASFADLLKKLIRTDDGAGGFTDGLIEGGAKVRTFIQEMARPFVSF